MRARALAVALCVGACGNVASKNPDAAPAGDAHAADAPPMPTPFGATVNQVPPVTFGGSGLCMYTITLQQLDVALSILPSGQVTTGTVQDLNVEAVIPSTTPNCPSTTGVIPPNIAKYTLASSTATAGGTTLTFQGATANAPHANLAINLTSVSGGYTAALTFQRYDGVAVVNWTVKATVTLQPR